MKLSYVQIRRYKRSLKSFIGYRASDRYACMFECPAWEVLGQMLINEHGMLDEFMNRYPIKERIWRRSHVVQAIALWLAQLAGGIDGDP